MPEDFKSLFSSNEDSNEDRKRKRKQRLEELTEQHQSLSAEWKSLSGRHDALLAQPASEPNDDKMEELLGEMRAIEQQLVEIEKDIYIYRQAE